MAQAFSVAGLAAHLGRGVGRVATDAIVGGWVGLPRSVSDIDGAVLSRVMGKAVGSVGLSSAATRGRRLGPDCG